MSSAAHDLTQTSPLYRAPSSSHPLLLFPCPLPLACNSSLLSRKKKQHTDMFLASACHETFEVLTHKGKKSFVSGLACVLGCLETALAFK